MINILIRLFLFCMTLIFFILGCFYIPGGYTIRHFNEDLQQNISSKIFYGFLTVANKFMSRVLEFDGINKLNKRENYLIISNHVNEYDFLVFTSLFKETKTMENLKFVMKPEMKSIPVIYQILNLLDFLTIQRNIAFDNKIISTYCDNLKNKNRKANIIIFPEGTIITENTLKKSNTFRKEKGLEEYKHVLSPRYRGFQIMLDSMKGSHITKVLDLTFTYTHGEMPTLYQMLFTNKKFKINYKMEFFDLNEIVDPKQFITDRWEEKEKWIGELTK
jgi:1-acyl-sn-glycerol-3-phosphate acyltransferase